MLVDKLQKQIKELQKRIEELEEEVCNKINQEKKQIFSKIFSLKKKRNILINYF